MVTASIKLPEQMLKSLVALSSIETLRRGRRVSWAALVRDTIAEHLLKPNGGVTAITQTK